MTAYHRDIRAALEAEGAANIRLEHGGKHLRYAFELNGRPRRFYCAATPSDWRAARNAVSRAKRLLRRERSTST